MYKVTVNFAHGVSHTFGYEQKHELDSFCDWVDTGVMDGETSNFLRVCDGDEDHPWLILNRDYICSVEIEEV